MKYVHILSNNFTHPNVNVGPNSNFVYTEKTSKFEGLKRISNDQTNTDKTVRVSLSKELQKAARDQRRA